MRIFKTIFVVLGLILVTTTACNKDEKFGVTFKKTGLYFKWGGSPQTISYTTMNVASVNVKKIDEGWSCKVDNAARTITVTPPQDPGTDEQRDKLRTASAIFNVIAAKGGTTTYAIDFYIIGDNEFFVNPSAEYANCYVLTQPQTAYTIDVSHNGGGKALNNVADVKLLWQSQTSLIMHLSYDETNKSVSFFVDKDTDDEGNDILENDKPTIKTGNAVIAAYNAAGEIVWSWHLWLVKESENPLNDVATYSNGVTFMNKNLGASTNHNGAYDDTDKILNSYGLYYQWGRKDPFLRPYYYDCTNNEDQAAHDTTGSIVYVKVAETSEKVGTMEYATANPMTFITNAACIDEECDGVGDWLHKADNTLWSNTTKSENDPCPYGWRVAAKGEFDVLSLSDEEDGIALDEARTRYGWALSDGANKHFYIGAGFRSYFDGIISNMNHKEGVYPSTPEPWEGYYWTTGISDDGKQSTCMYFDLTTTRTINKFHLNYPSKRANAMQVRCVKVK